MRSSVRFVWGFALLAVALGIGAVIEEEKATWMQWRGPDRTGHAPGQEWLANLKKLDKIWRIELGKGYPGPIVTTDRVFVAETISKVKEGVRALDRRTGEEIWRVEWSGEGSVPFFARRNGDWIRSTPVFDGKTLYVGGMEELLLALDGSTGQERWRISFPERFGTKRPAFGFASSPLVHGNFLYIQAADSLVKLDKHTGQTVWRAVKEKGGMMSGGAFSSPTITTLGGRTQLLVQTRLALNGVDLETGEVLWRQEVPSYRGMNILTPTVHGDTVFTSTYKHNSFLYKVQAANGSYSVREIWRNKAKGYMATPVVVGDFAYLHMANQRFTCLDLRTGETRWTTQPFGKYWSMAVRDGKILALDERGELHLVRANPDRFEMLDSIEIASSPTWGHVAVAGDEVFVRELEAVVAFRWRGTE